MKINTINGNELDLNDISPQAICIEDIAHSLSRLPRWTGHTYGFYSVAQHSLFVLQLVENDSEFYKMLEGYKQEEVRADVKKKLLLTALLHDSTEAYISDIPAPVKLFVPQLVDLERFIYNVIQLKYGLVSQEHPIIHKWDMFARDWEIENFRLNSKVQNYKYDFDEIKERFLQKFQQLQVM